MKAYELTSWLEKKYPSDAAEDWDNVGLLAGDDTNEISHVFLALDLTEETLAEARKELFIMRCIPIMMCWVWQI